MFEAGLLVVFVYGMLHAFGPDHLTAIADFSIGRKRRRVFMVALGFAIGHGVSLYLFALLLQQFNLSEEMLAWGDMAAAAVLVLMGLYLLYLVVADRIHLGRHSHNGHEHIHIWYGKEKEHTHLNSSSQSSKRSWWMVPTSLGVLMGIGGARGMLVSLAAISNDTVTPMMVLSFTLGVALIFLIFGLLLAWLNQHLMRSEKVLRGGYSIMGTLSFGVGTFLLIS